MTCSDVAKHLGVSWDAIRDIEKEYLHKHYARPSLKHVTPIAIDEIAAPKGHKYLTVVMDLKTGRVVFVGDGKDAAALKPFWKKLRRAQSKIVLELQRFANTLRNPADQLVNYITCEMTTGHLERFNNKIKTMKRQAYGFRDLEFFKLNILSPHNARYELVG